MCRQKVAIAKRQISCRRIMIVQDSSVEENSLTFDICSVRPLRRPQSKIKWAQKLFHRGEVVWCDTGDHSDSLVQQPLAPHPTARIQTSIFGYSLSTGSAKVSDVPQGSFRA